MCPAHPWSGVTHIGTAGIPPADVAKANRTFAAGYPRKIFASNPINQQSGYRYFRLSLARRQLWPLLLCNSPMERHVARTHCRSPPASARSRGGTSSHRPHSHVLRIWRYCADRSRCLWHDLRQPILTAVASIIPVPGRTPARPGTRLVCIVRNDRAAVLLVATACSAIITFTSFHFSTVWVVLAMTVLALFAALCRTRRPRDHDIPLSPQYSADDWLWRFPPFA